MLINDDCLYLTLVFISLKLNDGGNGEWCCNREVFYLLDCCQINSPLSLLWRNWQLGSAKSRWVRKWGRKSISRSWTMSAHSIELTFIFRPFFCLNFSPVFISDWLSFCFITFHMDVTKLYRAALCPLPIGEIAVPDLCIQRWQPDSISY